MRLRLGALASTLAAAALAGCSHTRVDADGRRHVVGFVALTLPPATAASAPGADGLRVRSLGVAFFHGPLFGGLSLGWQDTTLVVLRHDSAVGWVGADLPGP